MAVAKAPTWAMEAKEGHGGQQEKGMAPQGRSINQSPACSQRISEGWIQGQGQSPVRNTPKQAAQWSMSSQPTLGAPLPVTHTEHQGWTWDHSPHRHQGQLQKLVSHLRAEPKATAHCYQLDLHQPAASPQPAVGRSYKLGPHHQPALDRSVLLKKLQQLDLLEDWSESVPVLLQEWEETWKDVPLFQRLQESVLWWEENSPQFVVDLIQKGVQSDFPLPERLSTKYQTKTPEEIAQATSILEDYKKSGAVSEVEDQKTTKNLIPWFIIRKKEESGVKHRLMSDCRELNTFQNPARLGLGFKL